MQKLRLAFLSLPLLAGCGGANLSIAPTANFTLSAAPATVTLMDGGPSAAVTVAATPVNGFSSPLSISVGALPSGITATPSTLSITPGQLQQITFVASGAPLTTAPPVTLTATSGSLTHTTTVNFAVTAALVPDFTLSAAPATVTLMNGGPSTAITVAATGTNGFNDPVAVTIGGLPAGVTATPSTLSLVPGQLQQIMLRASGASATSAAALTLSATSGSLSHATTVSFAVTPAIVPDFTLSVLPGSISLTDGASAMPITIAATPINGLQAPIAVTITGLPPGIAASPSTLTLIPGQPAQVLLSATTAVPGTATLTLSGTSGSLVHTATGNLTLIQGLTTALVSAPAFSFGGNLVGSVLTKPAVTVTNTGNFPLTLSPSLSGDPSFSLVAAPSCDTSLASGSSCIETVSYAPTVASNPAVQTATLNLGLGNVVSGTPQSIALSGTAAAIPSGTVTATNNPQVALYSITLPFPGSMTVNFGSGTTYGHSTWSQSTETGGQINMLVAGMLPSSTYHLQAAVQLTSGVSVTDADHTFTTGASLLTPTLTVDPPSGLTPQPGVEELTFVNNGTPGIGVTDLQGNLLWSYVLPANGGATSIIEGVKLLPNGHFLITVCQNDFNASTSFGLVNAIREIDLAGNIVKEITAADLSSELQAAGYNITLVQFNHDVTQLANGHWLVLADDQRPFTNLPGYPGVTNVIGNVIVDLDTNLQPVWVWNDFDHLDVNRHPLNFPDWTHANAVLYSPSDGNLIYSLRHQNWVLKLDYKDGTGAGDILWRLGEGGDFTLLGGTDPVDWQYAQHYPSFFSANTSGIFSLGLMDNGDDRIFPAGVTCNTSGAPACQYSTIPVFQIDEGAHTATLTSHQILPPSLYSYFGGNTELLANGNTEYDLSAAGGSSADIFEVTPSTLATIPTTVWHMHSATNIYRGYRIPSLYPGVQW